MQSDWEFGAMPSEAPPATVDGVDLVVVPDENAHELLVASGSPANSVQLVLHSASARASAEASAAPTPSLVTVAETFERWTREAAGAASTAAEFERVVALPTPQGDHEALIEASASSVKSVELVRS